MSKALLKPFEEYQKARYTFVQSVADLSQRPQNILALHSAGVIQLLKPLLMDSVQVVQHTAALALGRLANYSIEIAESVVQNDILTQLIYSLSNQNRFYKRAACYVLRAVAKHSDKLADDIVKSGALDPLVSNLNDLEVAVKESAAWALGYIAKHNTYLAEQVVEARAVEHLLLCLRDPEVELKRAATQTLSYIAQHTPDLAQRIVDNGMEIISLMLLDTDIPLKRNICSLLGNIAKHSLELSITVWNSLHEPKLLLGCLKNNDLIVKKNTAFCIGEIVNKGPENSLKVANIGGIGVLVDFIAHTKGEPRLCGIIALGFIAAHNEKLAEGIIDVYGINYLKEALETEQSPHIKSACCFALGQIGKHAPKQANKIAEHNILNTILKCVVSSQEGDDLNVKGRRALKKIITNSNILKHLEPMLKIAPPKVMKHILDRYEKLLKEDRDYKRDFADNGGLRKLQELKADPYYPEDLKRKIEKINENYNSEVINYHSPHFQETIAKKLFEYAYSQD